MDKYNVTDDRRIVLPQNYAYILDSSNECDDLLQEFHRFDEDIGVVGKWQGGSVTGVCRGWGSTKYLSLESIYNITASTQVTTLKEDLKQCLEDRFDEINSIGLKCLGKEQNGTDFTPNGDQLLDMFMEEPCPSIDFERIPIHGEKIVEDIREKLTCFYDAFVCKFKECGDFEERMVLIQNPSEEDKNVSVCELPPQCSESDFGKGPGDYPFPFKFFIAQYQKRSILGIFEYTEKSVVSNTDSDPTEDEEDFNLFKQYFGSFYMDDLYGLDFGTIYDSFNNKIKGNEFVVDVFEEFVGCTVSKDMQNTHMPVYLIIW